MDIRSLGDDLFEVRVFFGPGYRIYFGRINKEKIILLWGGDKSSQKRDIEKVKKYWKSFRGVKMVKKTKKYEDSLIESLKDSMYGS